MTYLLAVGQIWRSLHSGRRYRVLAVGLDSSVRVECMDATFPADMVGLLPAVMFAPPAMQLDERAAADDFDAYLNHLSDRD